MALKTWSGAIVFLPSLRHISLASEGQCEDELTGGFHYHVSILCREFEVARFLFNNARDCGCELGLMEANKLEEGVPLGGPRLSSILSEGGNLSFTLPLCQYKY